MKNKKTLTTLALMLGVYALGHILILTGVINDYSFAVLATTGINIILATSLNLVTGFTGQFSLGHAGFMSIGAYVCAIITQRVEGTIGFVLGVLAAVYRDSWIDRAIKAYCYVLASVPTFWLGLVFLVVFAVELGWFPLGFSVPLGKTAAEVTLLDAARHIALPALTLSVIGVANIALHTREKAIDVLQSDYVRFARTRGEGTWTIVRKHGLRNLALPALTLQFASISEIFGGSVLVEQVFSYPGLGQAAVTAGLGGDVALLAGIAVFSAALVFAGNLVANVLYGVVDPRIASDRGKDGCLRGASRRLGEGDGNGA